MPLRRGRSDEITPKITGDRIIGAFRDRVNAPAPAEPNQQVYRLPPIHQKGPLAPSQEPIPAEQQHVYDAVNAERAAMAEALRMELASTEIHMDVLRERQVRLTQRLAQLEGTGAY